MKVKFFDLFFSNFENPLTTVGAEVTYTQFLFTYAQRTLGLSRDMCTLMNTVFWICFCLFRLLATFITRILSPRLMITANLTACITASILLYIAVHPVLVWISVGLFGAGLASTYPTTFSYAQKFVTITGKFASRFAIGGAIGWMTVPTITLYFFERHCRSMPLIVLISLLFNVCLMIMMNLKGKSIINQRAMSKVKDNKEDEVMLE